MTNVVGRAIQTLEHLSYDGLGELISTTKRLCVAHVGTICFCFSFGVLEFDILHLGNLLIELFKRGLG